MMRPLVLTLAILAGLLAAGLPAAGLPAAGILAAGPVRRAQDAAPPICTSWVQANEGAFGLGDPAPIDNPPYANEEGFEVLVYADRLYVGMEADNDLGARLWRTREGVAVAESQADWEEVAADNLDHPFGNALVVQNDHIDSLAAFGADLFASTANGGSSTYGSQVWRSPDGDPYPGAWVQVNADGFDDEHNTNFKDMQVFDGRLCGGTQNGAGAEVWCRQDGSDWALKNTGGFGEGANIAVWSGYVYNNALYFGVQNFGASPNDAGDDVAALYRTTSLEGSPTWTEVLRGPAGSRRVDILGDLNSLLYASYRSAGGIVVLRSASGNPGTWVQVNTPGMDGNPANGGAVVDSAVVMVGDADAAALYVGVFNLESGFELWRTTGVLQAGGSVDVDWLQVGTSGLGDPDNLYTQLIPFNSHLYAWTSNYASGQQVRRSDCVVPGGAGGPAVTPVLSAAISANDLRLTWTHDAGNEVYEVWRSTEPYAAVDAGAVRIVDVLAPATEATALFQDAGAAALSAAFYTVRGRNGAGEYSGGSNGVGVFTYPLAPGDLE